MFLQGFNGDPGIPLAPPMMTHRACRIASIGAVLRAHISMRSGSPGHTMTDSRLEGYLSRVHPVARFHFSYTGMIDGQDLHIEISLFVRVHTLHIKFFSQIFGHQAGVKLS